MIDIVLQRIASLPHATYGLLMDKGEPWLNTIEDPWKNNEPFVSCIPPGTYFCKRVLSPHFGDTFEIGGVPGRDHILFHCGDDEKDTEGCVLVGLQWGNYTGHVELDASKLAHAKFMKRFIGTDTFMLHVRR